jgi:DMSO reductase family type II enzyme molybdopterin subunit
MTRISRRQFLQGTGGALAALYLSRLAPLGDAPAARARFEGDFWYRNWEDLYREKWRWDKVAWGTHLVDCYPGSCLYRVYVKDDIVWREEQAGHCPTIEACTPDMNPRGCQKGASFSQVLAGPERLRYPLRRTGDRGSGSWERITWDEALTTIADKTLDAIQENGPESIIYEFGSGEGGIVHGPTPGWRLMRLVGGTVLDSNGLTSDYNVGLYETFGKFQFVSSIDDWFHADLILIWHSNPVYTRIPSTHYIWEARYNGSEVVCIAPDFSPSSIHTDLWVPVKPGTDAALALAVCKVILDRGLENREFIREQTDLPLLVRLDNGRFLRQSDLQEGGRDDQFYMWDAGATELVEASRTTLALDQIDPALEGTYSAVLSDGSRVEVTPAFELLKERLAPYTPAAAAAITGTAEEYVNLLAEKVTRAKAVSIIQGFDTPKYYHGDLMERAMALLLALTGNFGRKGTGMRGWNSSQVVSSGLLKRRTGLEGFMEFAQNAAKMEKQVLDEDPTLTPEMVAMEVERQESQGKATVTGMPATPVMVPPAFYWYYHAGYRDVWNRPEWNDASMRRSFDDYMQEAIDRGWWEGLVRPAPDKPPRVYIGVAGSTLRRTRGGFKQLLGNVWPKLNLVVSVELRMSTTAYFSDIVLPAAGSYEKVDFRFPTAHINWLIFNDKAVTPPGEAKPEWEIFCLLAQKIEERAKARGIKEYTDGADRTFRPNRLYSDFTLGRAIREKDDERMAEEMIADTVRVGALPEKTTLKTFREKGMVRFTGLGIDAVGLNLATDIKPDETVTPLTWHVERKTPYPTLTRRIQFYIDHEWFLEAGEELPVHKPNPGMGGDYPLTMTSGHQRWSVHSIWVVNSIIQRTHRGHPTLFMNPEDAKARGVADDEEVRVYNDFDAFFVRVRVTPQARPGQVIMYHAWEPYQHRGWKPYDTVIPGMIKWLHLAGGYGHLDYWRWNWVQQQIDRAVRVEVERVQGAGP